ncbi:Aldo/keto reductase family [Prochlorococcus marinus str. MIT 9515]|uniref:Aldo/keto reductase family n=1 Tax=Prochlorococcus marinus (strain MIT 9515) TaxID=167542 RepID=A2BU07_PROM5|nr:aldo/keto reductase [Prochlorococcus marinus]ABM71268.1 Aldo/keto reductase family [Prochlorococcus marinus str. MIT 9515]
MNKRIGLGTWSWGNKVFWDYQACNDNSLRETYNEALQRGFKLIDTADSYGTGKLNGRSEELLGKFLLDTSSYQKRRIKIATKLAPYPWRVGNKGFTRPFLNSLERLNNKLDIVQIHWSTAKYNPWQELQLLNNLCDLIDQGFNFEIGLSNIGPQRLETIIKYLSKRGKKVKSVQVQFSLLSPDYLKQINVKKICENNDIDFLAYSPLSFGILCIDPEKNEDNQSSFIRNLIFKNYKKSTIQLRKCLKNIAVSRSVSQAQVAINWCCYQGAIPLVGMRKKSQVIDISNVFKWNLNKKEFDKLQKASKHCLRKMPRNPFSSL